MHRGFLVTPRDLSSTQEFNPELILAVRISGMGPMFHSKNFVIPIETL
jgi:hypothetical protein